MSTLDHSWECQIHFWFTFCTLFVSIMGESSGVDETMICASLSKMHTDVYHETKLGVLKVPRILWRSLEKKEAYEGGTCPRIRSTPFLEPSTFWLSLMQIYLYFIHKHLSLSLLK